MVDEDFVHGEFNTSFLGKLDDYFLREVNGFKEYSEKTELEYCVISYLHEMLNTDFKSFEQLFADLYKNFDTKFDPSNIENKKY